MPSSGTRLNLKNKQPKTPLERLDAFITWKENILAAGFCGIGLYKEKSSVERYSAIIWPTFLPVCSGC